MRWEGGRQSDNIEDRRGEENNGASPVFRTGLSGIGFALLSRGGFKGILVLVVIFLGLSFFGYSPTRFLFGDGALVNEHAAQTRAAKAPLKTNDRRSLFIATVLAETEDTWADIFQRHNAKYKPPKLVRFSGSIDSPCGLATAAVGPFYCPADQKLYLDDEFFANALSVKIELQADCYAGVWAHSTEDDGILEEGDIGYALNAAAKIGDDTLQKQMQGYVVPDSFTHGTSAQRVNAFKTGYQLGKMESCDGF